MWHTITPVESQHNPIVSEVSHPQALVLLNAGPGYIRIQGWQDPQGLRTSPDINLVVPAGDQRIIQAALVRVKLENGLFAAVGTRLLLADPACFDIPHAGGKIGVE